MIELGSGTLFIGSPDSGEWKPLGIITNASVEIDKSVKVQVQYGESEIEKIRKMVSIGMRRLEFTGRAMNYHIWIGTEGRIQSRDSRGLRHFMTDKYSGGHRCNCGLVRNTLRSLQRHIKQVRNAHS